jgi:hypothetical protein
MAQKMGLSQTAIVRIWRAFGLQPHRVENFKLSKDPQAIARLRTARSYFLVRSPGCRQRSDDKQLLSATSASRVPTVP